MSIIAHIFTAIGLFFGGLFGGHAPAPAVPASSALPAALGTSSAAQGAPGGTLGAVGLQTSVPANAAVSFNGTTIPGADPATFATVSGPFGSATDYAKDKNHVYLGSTAVQGADPATFAVVSGPNDDLEDNVSYYYAKDKRYVFINNLVISGADPATFVAVTGSTTANAKDKNHSYKDGRVVQ